jgi:membrane protein insertase Oxa1/YidC/SpoIIIJ
MTWKKPHHQCPLQPQARCIATMWLPDAIQSFSIWGASGYLLKSIHGPEGAYLPYWACFAVCNILLRLLLFPVVVHGAQTAARFGKVIPDIQFLVSVYQNDMRKLISDQVPWTRRLQLLRMNLTTLGALYKLHKIHPLAIFLSPVLQMPFFIYLSIDLRKITNGLDPLLAQDLVDSSVAWIPDLTEPDPWFALPVLAGVAMYGNVQVATGVKSLAGPSAAKTNTGILLQDVFQSVAVLMPCFTSQLPAGIQIYVLTSFAFTIAQSAALRMDIVRRQLKLPLLRPVNANDSDAQSERGKYASQFIQLKKSEQAARELRGSNPVLGKGVLAVGYETSFPGKFRRSSIKGSEGNGLDVDSVVGSIWKTPTSDTIVNKVTTPSPGDAFVHGVSAPAWQLIEQRQNQKQNDEYLSSFDDELIEKANRGEISTPVKFIKKDDVHHSKLNIHRVRKVGRGKRRR